MLDVMSKPTVNVLRYGSSWAASAVMLPESMPPESWAPTGTSATSWRCTAWRKSRSSSSLVLLVGRDPSSTSVKSKSQ